MSEQKICTNCQSVLNENVLVCSCGKAVFPKTDEYFSPFNVFMIIFGYFFIFFSSGFIAGAITKAINKGGFFTPWDMGMITLGIITGKYFADKKGYSYFLWITLGGVCGAVISSLIYAYFIQYYFLNVIFNGVTGVLLGIFVGIAVKLSNYNKFKRYVYIIIGGMIGGLIANAINGTIIDFRLVGAFNSRSLLSNIFNGANAGIIFGLCFVFAERLTINKNAFISIAFGTLGAVIFGGIFGAIIDASNFSAYWSGLFGENENIFLNIRTGFIRDGIACGAVALSITLMNNLIDKNKRLNIYISNIIGGAAGGIIVVYIFLYIYIDLFSFTRLENFFYNVIDIKVYSENLWIIMGGISGSLIGLWIILINDIFKYDTLSDFKKRLVRSLGGFLGGALAGIVSGSILVIKSKSSIDIKLAFGIIFLISIICSIYGLLISLGLSLSGVSEESI
ncbi:hypothetical protein HY745_06145 [Candidatus Desantisbacteria bacterium]|nr:hypothetical protein [Candidatus Desantisbacteria bacterium]